MDAGGLSDEDMATNDQENLDLPPDISMDGHDDSISQPCKKHCNIIIDKAWLLWLHWLYSGNSYWDMVNSWAEWYS